MADGTAPDAPTRRVNELESQHAELRLQLMKARSLADNSDSSILAADVERAEATHRQLQAQLQRLEANTFIHKTSDRRDANLRLAELEDLVKRKVAECGSLVDGNMQADQARLAALQRRAQLEERVREMRALNERLQLDVDAQAKELARLEREMRLMRDRLPAGGQTALEEALAALASGQAAAFARLGQGPEAAPSQEPLTATSLGTIVERLSRERDQMSSELEVLRNNIKREAATSHTLRNIHLQELEDMQQRSRAHLLDREKWERIAASHLQTIQDLQRQISRAEAAQDNVGSGDADAASSSGFSDLSELDGGDNALDVCLGLGEVDATANCFCSELGGSSKVADQIRTLVCVELHGFEPGFSSVAVGLKPNYDSLVSFGPFTIDDAVLEYFSNGALTIELRAAVLASEMETLLGKGTQPLAPLLKYALHSRRNPVISAVVPIYSTPDARIQVATLRLKFRFRYAAGDLVQDFHCRRELRQMDREFLRDVDPAVAGRQTLCVKVERASGLPPRGRLPDLLRPYVFWQVPGHPPHFSRTGHGPHPVFGDGGRLVLVVDKAFCRWAETGGGLHFIVFDDAGAPVAAPAALAGQAMPAVPAAPVVRARPAEYAATAQVCDEESLGFIGETRVSLLPILRNAAGAVQGTFQLLRRWGDPSSPAAGALEVHLSWLGLELPGGGCELVTQPGAQLSGGVRVDSKGTEAVSSPSAAARHAEMLAASPILSRPHPRPLDLPTDSSVASGVVTQDPPATVLFEPSTVLTKIREAIARQGEQARLKKSATPGAMAARFYDKCCAQGHATVSRTDFRAMVNCFHSGLTDAQHQLLWSAIASDPAEEALTLTKFCIHFSPTTLETSLPNNPITSKHAAAFLHRWARTLRHCGQTAIEAFGSSSGTELDFELFLRACRSRDGFGLSRLELEQLHAHLASTTPRSAGVRLRGPTVDEMQAALMVVPEKLPEADWTRSLVMAIEQRGVKLENMFSDADVIDPTDVKTQFSKHFNMDQEQWATVLMFLDKGLDGQVKWQQFIRWARGALA